MGKIILDGDERDFLTYRWGSGKTVEIFDIAVGSERGVGKGRRLVEVLLSRVKHRTHLVFAITRVSNKIAREFYNKIGFQKIGDLINFYENESAVMYGRSMGKNNE